MCDTVPKYHLEGIFDPGQADPADSHALVIRLVPDGVRVLELGCASGYLSGYLAQHKGCTVTGVELDSRAAELAAKHCEQIIHGDLDDPETLNRIEGEFDVLLAPNVLEHLRYPRRVLRRMRAHLAPDGAAVVSLPNVAHWRNRLNLLRGRWEYKDYGTMDRTHLYFYTMQSGRALIESSGYKVTTFLTAGSLLQRLANRAARALGRTRAPNLLPGLLAYELIYVARVKG